MSSDASRQDTLDFLHKLITESRKVLCSFASNGVMCSVIGLIKESPFPEKFRVAGDGTGTDVPTISFAVPLEGGAAYADDRELSGNFKARFVSAFTIEFLDGSILSLFEFR